MHEEVAVYQNKTRMGRLRLVAFLFLCAGGIFVGKSFLGICLSVAVFISKHHHTIPLHLKLQLNEDIPIIPYCYMSGFSCEAIYKYGSLEIVWEKKPPVHLFSWCVGNTVI